MKNSIAASLIVLLLISCKEEELIQNSGNCDIVATVVDMSGLDGCGYMIKLENNELLYPIWRWGWCGTPPLPDGAETDPLMNFVFKENQSVSISYELPEQEYGNICMSGTQVVITCIEEITPILF